MDTEENKSNTKPVRSREEKLSKADKFKIQGNKLMTKVHKDFQGLRKLLNKRYYECSEENFQKMINSLMREIDELKSAYGSNEQAMNFFE